TVFRLNANGTVGDQVDRYLPSEINGALVWQTDPDKGLLPGLYVAQVSIPPPGYRVVDDQLLDPQASTTHPMAFEVKPDKDDPITLQPIEADPFPAVSGRIYRSVGQQDGSVTIAPIDDDKLGATLA